MGRRRREPTDAERMELAWKENISRAGRSWSKNPYYRREFESAWKRNVQGVRSGYGKHKVTSYSGGEGGHEEVSYQWRQWGSKHGSQYKLATSVAGVAQKKMSADIKIIDTASQERKQAAHASARGVTFRGTISETTLQGAKVRYGKRRVGAPEHVREIKTAGARAHTQITGTGTKTSAMGAAAMKKRTLLGRHLDEEE